MSEDVPKLLLDVERENLEGIQADENKKPLQMYNFLVDHPLMAADGAGINLTTLLAVLPGQGINF